MTSQADDYRHCTPLYYPGFSSLHPSPLPLQNGKQVSLSHGIGAVLSCYEEMLLRLGIRNKMPKYMKHPHMKDFVKDAFWWVFLEHFVSVDFELLLQQVKGNTLVNDDDMRAFQFDTVVPTHIQVADDEPSLHAAGISTELLPTLPVLKTDASVGAPTRHRLRDAGKKDPAHLSKSSNSNRKMDDVALIGSPRCVSALSIAESVEGHTQTKAPRFIQSAGFGAFGESSFVGGASMAALAPSPRGPQCGDDSDSDASEASTASTVSSAMRVTTFSNTRVQLHKLPQEIRLQIAAKEQHQLFTRMAMNYGSMCTETMGMNVALKDAITRLLPEVLSQLTYYLFARSIPYAMRLLDIPFQLNLGQTFSFWIGGIERIYNVRNWGVHAYLDPIKRMRKMSRNQSVKSPSSHGPRKSAATARERGFSSKELSISGRNRSTVAGSVSPAPPRSSNANNDGGGGLHRDISVMNISRRTDQTAVRGTSDPPPPPMGSRNSSDTSTASKKNSDSPSTSIAATGRRSDIMIPTRPSDAPPSKKVTPRISDAPSARKATLDLAAITARKSDAPPSFIVGEAINDAASTAGSDAGRGSPHATNSFRTVKSMRRYPPGALGRAGKDRGANYLSSGNDSEDRAAHRREQIVRNDIEGMKNELGKLRTTHTFAQFHYSGHMTRQVPTFRDADIEVDPTSGKLAGVEERLPARIAHAFAIGPKKRNIQVIKEDLDSKFLSNAPWYAGRGQRVPIKDHSSVHKFALNNWSPLLHRFMAANGEENLRPVEVMNWTV